MCFDDKVFIPSVRDQVIFYLTRYENNKVKARKFGISSFLSSKFASVALSRLMYS